jgi:hypothetical protein
MRQRCWRAIEEDAMSEENVTQEKKGPTSSYVSGTMGSPVKLRRKYTRPGVAKATRQKGSGNNGTVGVKGRKRQRAPR